MFLSTILVTNREICPTAFLYSRIFPIATKFRNFQFSHFHAISKNDHAIAVICSVFRWCLWKQPCSMFDGWFYPNNRCRVHSDPCHVSSAFNFALSRLSSQPASLPPHALTTFGSHIDFTLLCYPPVLSVESLWDAVHPPASLSGLRLYTPLLYYISICIYKHYVNTRKRPNHDKLDIWCSQSRFTGRE